MGQIENFNRGVELLSNAANRFERKAKTQSGQMIAYFKMDDSEARLLLVVDENSTKIVYKNKDGEKKKLAEGKKAIFAFMRYEDHLNGVKTARTFIDEE
jgi:hypothetical protein